MNNYEINNLDKNLGILSLIEKGDKIQLSEDPLTKQKEFSISKSTFGSSLQGFYRFTNHLIGFYDTDINNVKAELKNCLLIKVEKRVNQLLEKKDDESAQKFFLLLQKALQGVEVLGKTYRYNGRIEDCDEILKIFYTSLQHANQLFNGFQRIFIEQNKQTLNKVNSRLKSLIDPQQSSDGFSKRKSYLEQSSLQPDAIFLDEILEYSKQTLENFKYLSELEREELKPELDELSSSLEILLKQK